MAKQGTVARAAFGLTTEMKTHGDMALLSEYGKYLKMDESFFTLIYIIYIVK
jgi:hypothetical protein